MNILLKNIINEETADATSDSPLKVQIYCDMDGVLVDMEKGFKAISGGYSPNGLKNKFGGDMAVARKEFWKLIGRTPNFWINLEPMPDAHILWKFISENFKDPVPVILSAGQGRDILKQKTDWIRKHISPTTQVILSPGGVKKPNYVINHNVGPQEYITHVLIDDTQKNLDAWNNTAKHQIAIPHNNAAQTIKSLKPFISQK